MPTVVELKLGAGLEVESEQGPVPRMYAIVPSCYKDVGAVVG